MRVWERELYEIRECEFDFDLKCFEVVYLPGTDKRRLIATIYPDTVETMDDLIESFEKGEGVEGWETGDGDTVPRLSYPFNQEIEFTNDSRYYSYYEKKEPYPFTKTNIGNFYEEDDMIRTETQFEGHLYYYAEYRLEGEYLTIARKLANGDTEEVSDLDFKRFVNYVTNHAPMRDYVMYEQ